MLQENDKTTKRLQEMEKEELILTSKKLIIKCRELQEKIKVYETNFEGRRLNG